MHTRSQFSQADSPKQLEGNDMTETDPIYIEDEHPFSGLLEEE